MKIGVFLQSVAWKQAYYDRAQREKNCITKKALNENKWITAKAELNRRITIEWVWKYAYFDKQNENMPITTKQRIKIGSLRQ